MTEPSARGNEGRQNPMLFAVIGLFLGMLFGALAALFFLREPTIGSDSTKPVDTTGVAEQRWFIWEGGAPLIGDPFKTEGLCENSRRALVDRNREQIKAANALPPMTISEMRALGNPAERMSEQFQKVFRAYCRQEQ